MKNNYELAKIYVENLKENGILDELVEEYNRNGNDALNDKVLNLVTEGKYNEISDEDNELMEMKLIVLFAAIKDKISNCEFVFEQDKNGKNLFVRSVEDKEFSSKAK